MDTNADWQRAVRNMRAGIAVLIACVLGVAGWSAFAPISGAVVAEGVVKVEGNRKTVQHQEGGIVKQIFVKDGDRVTAGQELIRLDDVRISAGGDQLAAQLDGERAREARLAAERDVAARPAFPADLVKRQGDARITELLGRETMLFQARRDMLTTQTTLLRQQAAQTDSELAAVARQIESARKAVAAVREELKAATVLVDQGFIQKTRVLNLERDLNQQTSFVESASAEFAKAQQRKSELQLKIVSTRQNYIQAASDELKDSTTKRVDLEERLRPLADAQVRQRLVAPVAGTVVDLRFFTVGAVIGPRDPVLDIVPDDGALVIEARVRVDEMNEVAVGTPADVRLTAFKQRVTPLVHGEVSYLSADRQTDRQTGQSFFTAHIRVSAASLKEAGDLRIAAGMPTEVFIKTRERSVIDYLIDPLVAGMRRGMRER